MSAAANNHKRSLASRETSTKSQCEWLITDLDHSASRSCFSGYTNSCSPLCHLTNLSKADSQYLVPCPKLSGLLLCDSIVAVAANYQGFVPLFQATYECVCACVHFRGRGLFQTKPCGTGARSVTLGNVRPPTEWLACVCLSGAARNKSGGA